MEHPLHQNLTNNIAAQTAREDEMKAKGAHRARTGFQKAVEQGRTAETPAGVQLAKRAIAPLADAIRAFVTDAYKGRRGRKHSAAKLLKDVDAELAAYLTVRVAIGKASLRHTLRSAATAVADQLELELLADAMEGANSGLYRSVLRNARARGLSPERQGLAVREANRHFGLVERPWTKGERLHLGTKLIELTIETLGIVNSYLSREGRTHQTHRLELTPEIDAWVKQYNEAAALVRPILLPTVVPPKPWTSVRGGAYYTDVIRGGGWLVTRPFKGQMEALTMVDMRRQPSTNLSSSAWSLSSWCRTAAA
jgi:DNA-directed RNA polymerase, mitochondrial